MKAKEDYNAIYMDTKKKQTTTVKFKKGTSLSEHPDGTQIAETVKERMADPESADILEHVFAEDFETVTLKIYLFKK